MKKTQTFLFVSCLTCANYVIIGSLRNVKPAVL